MTKPSPEQLRGLIDLQATDVRVRRLRHQLDDLVEQRALDEVETRSRALSEAHDATQLDLDRVGAEQRRLENDVNLLRQRRDAEQAHMYGGGITNPRELQGLRAELDSTGRRISQHEDELLDVMERREGFETTATGLQGSQDQLADELERLTQARDDAAKGLLAELAELEAGRDRQRDGLPADLLERYDDVAQRFSGTAVGELSDGMCTACRIELPVAEINQLLDGPPLTTCPQCRRLLVVAQ